MNLDKPLWRGLCTELTTIKGLQLFSVLWMVKDFNTKVKLKLKTVTENEINNKTCFIIIMGDWLANLVFKNSLKYQNCIFVLICCIYIFLFDFFFLKEAF